jgi:mono/diheme cytochrome c family protein
MIKRILPVLAFMTAVIAAARPAYLQTLPVQSASQAYQNVYNGWKWWHVYCYRCHGTNGIGATLAPNLIDPKRRLPLADFLRKVRNGNPDKGMQAWKMLLNDKQITQIYTYVLARSDRVLPPGRPDELGPKKTPWVPPSGWPKR